MVNRIVLLTLFLTLFSSPLLANQEKILVFKGNSASSYSLPSLLFASMRHPDFIELPVVLSKDNVPVVFDDLFLHPNTNVAELFPERKRSDGNYYVIDFTFSEITQLSYRKDDGEFGDITSHLPSLEDSLRLLEHLKIDNKTTFNVLPIIKYPWFHVNEARDISSIVINTLISHSESAESLLFLKCYDPDELQRIQKELLPGLPVEVRLVQGIDKAGGRETMRNNKGVWTSYNYDWLFTRLGLRVVAGYANAISLDHPNIVDETTLSRFIGDSQGLKINVFLATSEISPDRLKAIGDKYLFMLNADGMATAKPALLYDLLQSKVDTLQQASTEEMKEKKESSEAILSDPENLIERLRNAQ